MDILKSNFKELLPSIEESILNCDFVAIDTELTGLSERVERIKSFDDPVSRYNKVRIAATKFLIIQFGLCTYTYSHTEDCFIAKPFNFYIFPADSDRKDYHDICFMCSGSSLHFLSNCGFDFNKLISYGIPFLNYTDEEKLLQRRSDISQRQMDNPVEDDIRASVENAITIIDDWLHNSTTQQLTIETPTVKEKRLLFQEFRARFIGYASADSKPKSILFIRFTKEQREKKSQKNAEEAVVSNINFRTIIELLVKSKKPIVGHNCLLDLCQLVHQFWKELPEKLKDWKSLVHEMFEVVIDTKHIAASNHKLQELIPRNGVQDILEIVQTENFEKIAPKAGYDAYITGYNFLRLATFVLHEKEIKVDLYNHIFNEHMSDASDETIQEIDSGNDPEAVTEEEIYVEGPNLIKTLLTTEKVNIYYNKLHLLRSDFKYINLVGDNGYPLPKTNGFLLSDVPASCNQIILHIIFAEFGNIFFQWIDDTNCWMVVKNDKKADKVPEGMLGESKFFKKFKEGGKNYELAREKGITVQFDGIYIKSWGKWLRELMYAEEDNQINEEEGEYMAEGEEECYDKSRELMEFEFTNSFPPPQDLDSSWPIDEENEESLGGTNASSEINTGNAITGAEFPAALECTDFTFYKSFLI
nr:4220_t:CDS:10 [Entrophospora candida]